MTQLDPANTAFNLMAASKVLPFIENYKSAVQLCDVNWLEKNVIKNAKLTQDNRRWLANLEVTDHTPFAVHAVNRHHHTLLGFLLNEGAAPDLPMLAAIVFKDSAAVKMACDAKADANTSLKDTPCLNVAAALFDAESCGHLMNAGAQPNACRNNLKNATALFDAVGAYERLLSASIASGKPVMPNVASAALKTMGLLLERGVDAHQAEPGQTSAYSMADLFSVADPRPLNLIREWQQDGAPKLQVANLLDRYRLPKPAR